MMNGILPLWKPKGMTSHDCVMKIRKLLKTKKVGHTGTLDPEVAGVLAICVGQATKLVPYLTEMKKTYIVTCSLGIATETEDAHGEIVEEVEIEHFPSLSEITNALKPFIGQIKQTPPMYSAVRVKGKRLYEYARQNLHVERPTREVHIYEIADLKQENAHSFTMKVTCSKGTYMRTLCVDIGKKLGYPAHMSELIRIEAGSFSADESIDFSQVEQVVEKNDIEKILFPLSRGLQHFDQLVVDETVKQKVLHGQKLPRPKKELKTDPFIIICDKQILAIYQTHPENNEQIKPVRVFQSDEM